MNESDIVERDRDRERIRAVEVGYTHLEEKIEDIKKRLERVESCLDSLKKTIYLGMGVFFTISWIIQIFIERR
jgi:hypothetical protein